MHSRFADAVRDAAAQIDGGPSESFREERVERALIAALRAHVEPNRCIGARRQFPIPGWDPQPGGVNLFVLDDAGSLSIVAELKVDDIEDTLWDLFKMAALTESGARPSAYLVVAARAARWRKPSVDCAPLFPSENGSPLVWSSHDLFERYVAAWRWLLKHGRARPVRVPAAIEVTFVANEPVRSYPSYELQPESGAGKEIRRVGPSQFLSILDPRGGQRANARGPRVGGLRSGQAGGLREAHARPSFRARRRGASP
jgi:hypothetical protein